MCVLRVPMTTATIALLLAAAQPKRAAQPTRDVVLQQIHGVVDGAQLLRPCSSNVSPNPSMAAVDLVFFRRESLQLKDTTERAQEYMLVLSVPVTTTAHAVQLQAKLQQLRLRLRL